MARIRIPDGYAAVLRTFGNINAYIRKDGTLKPSWEAEKIVRVELPQALPYMNTKIPITRVAVHRLIAVETKAVFAEIHRAGKWKDLENYGGGFAFRAVRGRPDKVSLHSFGIAFDFDVYDNPLGSNDLTKMNPTIVKIFTEHGFMWGGKFQSRKDTQHFQFATGC